MPQRPEWDDLFAQSAAVPAVPPRTRLFNLKPRQPGEARREGLLSYLVRLARAHAVSPRRLIQTEFARAQPAIAELGYGRFFADYAGTVNGLGKYAQLFTQATEHLTGRRDARLMTLLPWQDVLAANGSPLLARARQWCPTCLAEMAEAGEIYGPLVWSLDAYTLCTRHEQSLHRECPWCHRRQAFIPRYPDLGRCTACGGFLGVAQAGETGIETRAFAPAEDERWAAAALENWVGSLENLDAESTHTSFLAFLIDVVERHAQGNRAAFCRRMGLPPRALNGWFTKQEKPSLPQILAIGFGTRTWPDRMLVRSLAADRQPGPLVARTNQGFLPRERSARLNAHAREVIRRALAAIAGDAADTRPLARIAPDLGVRPSYLRYWFPDICRTIGARHRVSREEQVAVRHEAQRLQVTRVVTGLQQAGIFPARRKVEAILRREGLSLRRHDLRRAYRDARRMCSGPAPATGCPIEVPAGFAIDTPPTPPDVE